MTKSRRFRAGLAVTSVVSAIAATIVPLMALADPGSTDCFNYNGYTKSCSMNIACGEELDFHHYFCKQICTGYGYQDPGCCYYLDEKYHYYNAEGDCPCATPGNQYEVITVTQGTDPNKTCYTAGGSVAPCQTAEQDGSCI